MPRKLKRGKPLEELVKGSLTHTISAIESAFRDQFAQLMDEDWGLYVVEAFADYVIVKTGDLAPDGYWKVDAVQEGDTYIFAEREEWEAVELSYQPRQILEQRLSRDDAKRFVETGPLQLRLLDEAEARTDAAGPWRIGGIGLTAGVVNENHRRYMPEVVAPAVDLLRTHLHESAGQGRACQLYGESEHPSMKATRRPFLNEVVVNWDTVTFDGRQILVEGNLLGTTAGRDIRAQMLGGVKPGISQRAYGESEMVEVDGEEIEEVTALIITGYDLTVEPSDPHAGVTYVESRQDQDKERSMPDEITSNEDQEQPSAATLPPSLSLEELRSAYPHLVAELAESLDAKAREKLEKQIEQEREKAQEREQIIAERESVLRSALNLEEGEDLLDAITAADVRLRELEERAQREAIEAHIDHAVEELEFPAEALNVLKESVRADGPTTVEEADALMQRRKDEFGKLFAADQLQSMGFRPKEVQGSVEVIGPVFESLTNVADFAKPCMELTESLIQHGFAVPRDLNKPENMNQVFAARYLEMYDERYRHKLALEAKEYAEAEQTTDLNLPYSVMRTIIAEAFPNLVASSVFDFGMMEKSPDRLYFEAYSAETGHTVSVTDEQIANVVDDAWRDLANARIVVGSVTVEDYGTSTAYTEWTDYIIDYELGRIYVISAANGGTIPEDADGVDVTYQYYAFRKGEMAAIERAKQTLSYITIEAAADRLAAQISDEAITFSRSQLGWDATARTINGLVQQVRRRIDEGVIYKALAAVHTVPSNSGGTWTAATDDVEELIEYIGVAKVLVINRYYEPTFILTSVTNGDRISNSDQASAAGGRADFAMAANGFVTRVKGLNVFASTEMPDSRVLVGNRELAQHRVYKPMQLKGPFVSFADAGDGTNKLVAADQYYVEEYNATATPIEEKGSVVVVA